MSSQRVHVAHQYYRVFAVPVFYCGPSGSAERSLYRSIAIAPPRHCHESPWKLVKAYERQFNVMNAHENPVSHGPDMTMT